MIRVLVTRPEPGASRTVQRLELLGYEPIKVAFTEIMSLDHTFSDSRFDCVIATSAQAFLQLPDAVAAPLRRLDCYVVGQATAKVAQLAGFDNIQNVASNVAELVALLALKLKGRERIVYLCGKVRRPDVEKTLAARSINVTALEVYDTQPVSNLVQRLGIALSDDAPQAVLVTSMTNAEILCKVLQTPPIAALFGQAQYFCLSQRIADLLVQATDCRVLVAQRPDENGLIALLMAQYPTSS